MTCFFFSTQPMRKVCIANRNIGQLLVFYSVLFHFVHICRWDQCAVHILYSKISTDPGRSRSTCCCGHTVFNSIYSSQASCSSAPRS